MLGNTKPACAILHFAMKSRSYLITVNNPQQEWDQLNFPETVTYCVGQLESGESGTPHWQLLIKYKHPVRLKQVKKIFPTCHAEPRKGSEIQGLRYVLKEESRVKQLSPYGISQEQIECLLSSSNKASTGNLTLIKEKLDAGMTEGEVADQFFGDWVRHYKAFRAYKLLKTIPRSLSDQPTVIVIYGPTGTGKSRFCMEQYPNAYWKQRSNWWDGYSSETTVILDEFYGWIPYDLLLRLCDRYPLMLETKGGQVHCLAHTIIITSNSLPNTWYKNCYFKSLERRVTKWMYFGEHFTSVYKNHDNFIQSVQ